MRVMTVEEVKAFETNDQIIFITKKFQDAMAKFDAFESKVHNISTFFDQTGEKIANFEKTHQDIFNMINDAKKAINSNSNALSGQEVNSSAKFSSISSEMSKVNSQLNSVMDLITHLTDQIAFVRGKLEGFASSGLVFDLKKDIQLLLEEVRSKYQSHEEKFDKFTNQIDSYKIFLQTLTQDINEAKGAIPSIKGAINNLSGDIGLGKQYLNESISKLKTELLTHVNNSIAAVPQPDLSKLDETKKALEEKIVPSALDARNANLRSSNNEQKILILEKKVEQLQLMINKLQISG